MGRYRKLYVILIICVSIFLAVIISTTITNLNAQQKKLESQRYQMVQGRNDRSQLFVLDTYTGTFWYIDYWGIPDEKPRIKGPYEVLEGR